MTSDHRTAPPPASTPHEALDEALVQRAIGGDRAAFDALFRHHRAAIQRFIQVRVRDESVAEELTQRTFLRALEGVASFRLEATFSTWLHAIATNVVRNFIRDEPKRRAVSLDDVDLITNALSTGKLVAREVRQKLAGAIAELSPKQRMVVELHLLRGLGFREIAPLVDSTEESARRNYSHAVKRLREVLLPPDE